MNHTDYQFIFSNQSDIRLIRSKMNLMTLELSYMLTDEDFEIKLPLSSK